MNTSGTEVREALAQSLTVADDALAVTSPGRWANHHGPTRLVPTFGTWERNRATELAFDWGRGSIHWPDLDERYQRGGPAGGAPAGREPGVSPAVACGAQERRAAERRAGRPPLRPVGHVGRWTLS
jgi:hypothetical protein